MKKCILLVALMYSLMFYSQQKNDSLKQNEFKINLAYLIAGYPEITYERLLTDETSVGISMLFSINDTSSNENNNESSNGYNFSLIPYYRVYFGQQTNSGFFIDGNLALYSQKHTTGDFFTNAKEGGTGFGIGFGVGKKYKTKKGWVAEFTFGLIRTLINADKIDLIYPRVGITIGKQF
ncbi:DUF3575 domain-containing protein [Polaribacter glomeratus]|uniref:DUF3575 domain-containing protein n=1 Tax=Polaribacter glomeratus TaxID=102 RepID=A0A2S7WGD2_9FLAO|nr:DUF3575 domain-containing protein [Polaribacter glomeratus]PQJ76678.1 hypothetical protein BTO16_12390 [Polaribacter glomeratus]TXD67482.1 DUF3575 domain-containing protein [Polaribacter glomeratus]